MRKQVSQGLATIFFSAFMGVTGVFAQNTEKPKTPPEKCTPTVDWKTETLNPTVHLQGVPIYVLNENTLDNLQKLFAQKMNEQCGRDYNKKKDKDALEKFSIGYVDELFRRSDNEEKYQERQKQKLPERIVKDLGNDDKIIKGTSPSAYRGTNVSALTNAKTPDKAVDGCACVIATPVNQNRFKDTELLNMVIDNRIKSKNTPPDFAKFFFRFVELHEMYHCLGADEALSDQSALLHMIKEEPDKLEWLLDCGKSMMQARYLANFLFMFSRENYAAKYLDTPRALHEVINYFRAKNNQPLESEIPVLTLEEHTELAKKMYKYQIANMPSPLPTPTIPDPSRPSISREMTMITSADLPAFNLEEINLKNFAKTQKGEAEKNASLYLAETLRDYKQGWSKPVPDVKPETPTPSPTPATQ